MRLIRLDFVAGSRRPFNAGVVLLVAGVLFAGAAVMDDASQSERIADLQAQQKRAGSALARTQMEQRGGRGFVLAGFSESDRVVRRLTRPWGNLLGALEHAQNESIALLGIEPLGDQGTLRLSGEVKDLPALVAYMKSIDGQGGISAVRLMTQQVKADDAQHPVAFVVEARWDGLTGETAGRQP